MATALRVRLVRCAFDAPRGGGRCHTSHRKSPPARTARAGARKAAGGGALKRKGGFVQNGGFVPRCPSPFQEDRLDSRFHECALLRLHVPKTFLHTEPSDSPIGACSGVDGLRAQTLELARLLSWLARAHPSNPVCPRPSVKCRCPRVAAATEGRQEVHRAAPGSHTRAQAHEA